MNRFICVYYNKNDNTIKKIREKYNDNLYQFHKRYTKIKFYIDKKYKKLIIKLKGFDGGIKKTYNKFNVSRILRDIDDMPMG